LYRPAIPHEEIISELRPVLEDFSKHRLESETFGDFCIRKEYVKETGQGSDFHD
jgi:sulfite reductase (NADPH) hemoprotein beta-component